MRLLFKSAFALVIVFMSFISVIRARPYSDNDFRSFFLPPEDCLKPCWQGIRPGNTTINEAVMILETSAWAQNIVVDKRKISWLWRGNHPESVDTDTPGTMYISNNRIAAIIVPINVAFGDLQLFFGQPRWRSAGKFNHNVSVQFTYPHEYLTLSVRLECPMNIVSFWNAQPEIVINSMPAAGMPYTTNIEFLKNC